MVGHTWKTEGRKGKKKEVRVLWTKIKKSVNEMKFPFLYFLSPEKQCHHREGSQSEPGWLHLASFPVGPSVPLWPRGRACSTSLVFTEMCLPSYVLVTLSLNLRTLPMGYFLQDFPYLLLWGQWHEVLDSEWHWSMAGNATAFLVMVSRRNDFYKFQFIPCMNFLDNFTLVLPECQRIF